MSQQVIQVTKTQMQKINDYYQDYRLAKTVPYTHFVAKKNGITITAYTSGKVMFQGANAAVEATKWQGKQGATATKKTSSTRAPSSEVISLHTFSDKNMIGSDEVGNGSYFGPLIVCATYVETAQFQTLKALGVKDSKMLTDDQIRSLAPKIKELVPYQLLNVSPKKYNEIQPRYNAVRMKVALHNQAIQLLLKKIAPIQPEGILIDQFTSEKNYRNYLQQETQPVTDKLSFVTKGEQYHLAVAAASILCRAQFLESLDDASKELGWTVPSGAGSKSDQLAAKILKKGGIELLENYAKLHFANTQKAQKIVNG